MFKGAKEKGGGGGRQGVKDNLAVQEEAEGCRQMEAQRSRM